MPNCRSHPDSANMPNASPNRLPPCAVSEIAQDIRLCQVDIEALVRDWFGDLEIGDLRRPARDLSFIAALRDWLAPGEWEAVQGFKALKRQVEWLAGRLAVKTLVTACLDARLAPGAITVAYEPHGAPYLPLFPDHCLSITHAGRWAAAALSLDPARAVGIDIERRRIPTNPAFLQLLLSDREQTALDGSDALALVRTWTLKEAYLKYIRQGFHRSLRQVAFLDGRLLEGGRPAPVRWNASVLDSDHLLAVVDGPHPSRGAAIRNPVG
jgi:4'-phosphopantetheinyl transferase